MKKLNIFTRFDFDAFASGKRFTLINQKPWADYNSGEVLGTKFELVITQDKTDYGTQADGEVVTNLYEKFTVKVPKNITMPLNVEVAVVNPTASVYGDYRNNLSVVAEGLKVITKT